MEHKNLTITFEDIEKVASLQEDLHSLLAKINARADYIIGKIMLKYSPGKTTYWAWNIDSEENWTKEFIVGKNTSKNKDAIFYQVTHGPSIAELMRPNKTEYYFIDMYGDEWNLMESCPLEWLLGSNDEFEMQLKDGMARAINAVQNSKVAKIKKTKDDKIAKEALKKSALAKLTPEERNALGI